MSRRDFLKGTGLAATAAILAACKPQVVEKEVVKEVTTAPQIVEKQVTVQATAAPKQAAEVILMYQTNEISDDELKLFNEKYAPYKVTRIDVDFTKLFAMLAAGDAVDMVRVVGTFVPRYVIQRVCKDLTDYYEISAVLKPDDLMPANNFYLVNNRRYGMAKDWSPDFSIWANKKLWAEANVELPDPQKPLSLQEWRALSPKLTKKEGDRTLVMGTDFEGLSNPLVWLTTTFEPPTSIFSDDFTKLSLRDNPKFVEVLQFFFDWKKEKGIPSAINPFPSESWSGQDWVQAQAASTMWGYWFSGMAESDLVVGDDIVMLSAATWGPNYSNPCVSGTGAFITSTTRVPDATWKVFEWFMGEEPAQGRAKSGWGVPALKSLLPLMPKDKPWRQQNFDMVNWEIANTKTAFVQWSPYITPDALSTTWNKYEEPALKGEMTLDEMLKNVETEVNQSLQEGVDEAGL